MGNSLSDVTENEGYLMTSIDHKSTGIDPIDFRFFAKDAQKPNTHLDVQKCVMETTHL